MKSPPTIIGIIIFVLLIVAGVSYFILIKPSLSEAPSQAMPPTEQPAATEKIALSRESETSPQVTPSTDQPAATEKIALSGEGEVPPEPPLNFQQKMESIRQAIVDVCATGQSQEVKLAFTETEANNQAVELLADAEIPANIPLEIESVHIDFQSDNNVLVEAKSIAYNWFRGTIKVKAHVTTEEGEPKVEITKISFGFIPLPGLIKDQIVALLTAEIDEFLRQLSEAGTGCNGRVNIEFTDIRIQEEKVVIELLIKTNKES